CLQTLQILF
nr:immunoglobulin light chain junction region [Homo sapiens]